MKFSTLVLSCFLLSWMMTTASCSAQKKTAFKPDTNLLQTIDKNFQDGAAQYKVMMKKLTDERFPRTYYPKLDSFRTSGSDWWCSGFYPGTLLYLYEQTKDQSLIAEAQRMLHILKQEQFNKTTHDLGFMMYCSFGNALQIAPKPEYKDILLNSARSLASRFDPKVGLIKSWDAKPTDYLVIIDNMMNLELLFWASKVSGDPTFYNIAVTHANNTMLHHFRPDYSSYHVVEYNPENGAVKKRRTQQGYADESAWARGQAWGLYGYTVMYRETKDKKYLDQAQHIAHFILNHPNLPKDKIPYWDFNAPNIPNALRDASAGAIIASALIELSGYVDKPGANTYLSAAETMIQSLSSDTYKAAIGTNGGYILAHSVGSLPQDSEVDVPLTYADYYFVEAMKRYKELKGK